MEYVTIKEWQWTTFKGDVGNKLTNDLPADVIAALLKQSAIEPIKKPEVLSLPFEKPE